jgi:enoyl-CoA hydratase/carnithine racemase
MPEVEVSLEGPIRHVTLNRPEKRNALTPPMLRAIEAAFPSEPGREERAAVLRGRGSAFSAGIDLSGEFSDGESAIGPAFSAIERYPLPVVAVVQGDAVAGGAELALHCDVVVAAEGARFSMPLARIGLTPPWPFIVKLVDVAGPALAREMLLVGDVVPAGRLAALGVIARAVPDDALGEEVDAIVGTLAASAPLSLKAMKAALVRIAESGAELRHDDVDELSRAAARSSDAREGMKARLERRPPIFEGR